MVLCLARRVPVVSGTWFRGPRVLFSFLYPGLFSDSGPVMIMI